MRPQSAKAKGRRLQQETVKNVLDTFPHLQPDDVTSRSMGAAGSDLLLSPAAKRVFPYYVECKNVESLNIHKTIAQAEAGVAKLPKDGIVITPMIVFRKNSTRPYVAVPFHHYLELIKPDGLLFS